MKRLGLLLGLMLLVGAAAGYLFVREFRAWLVRPLPVAEPQTIEVLPGETVRGLSNRLGADGVLDHPWLFVLEARLSDRANRIEAGEYRVTPQTTPLRLLDDMVVGRVVTYFNPF